MNPLEKRIDEYLNSRTPEGGRNQELFKMAALAKDLGYSESDAVGLFQNKASSDGLKSSEIQNTIKSAYARPVDSAIAEFRQGDHSHDHKSGFIGWDDDIGGLKTPPKRLVESYAADVPPPSSDWIETDFKRLLNSAFEPGELVNIVNVFRDQKGKLIPSGKGFHASTEQLDGVPTNQLVKHDQGAWLRINPTDGQGVGDANITAFRHALVESDSLDIGKQLSIYKELQLPVSALIHSGGKSIHAWVRIEASNIDQYKKRVKYLYELLEQNGFEIDHSNKNPSRLSRMVGVQRGEGEQYLISERSGFENWESWINWLETKNDELPEIESLNDLMIEAPELAPELIQGVLRQGHKMLLSGVSKSGKSFLQINLALCLAAGRPWLGLPVKKCPVLYANFEIDKGSFYHRIIKVKEALGIEEDVDLDVWNLRGRSAGIEDLAPKIIHKIKSKGYGAVILDPIYKVLGNRDENSAGDIISFFNFLDQIGVQSGCSIIVAHHFSKGIQGQKTNHDRMSGSGVFGRDPDALVTLSALQDEENGYRMEGTLREFPALSPLGVRFDYPIHVIDPTLDGKLIEGEKKAKISNKELMNLYFSLFGAEDLSGGVTLKEFSNAVGMSEGALRSRFKGWTEYIDGIKLINRKGIVFYEEST